MAEVYDQPFLNELSKNSKLFKKWIYINMEKESRKMDS